MFMQVLSRVYEQGHWRAELFSMRKKSRQEFGALWIMSQGLSYWLSQSCNAKGNVTFFISKILNKS